MSHTSNNTVLTTVGLDDQVKLRYISPFWVVMLAGRDTSGVVNIIPCIEEYRTHHPVAKTHGKIEPGSSMSVKLPFLTNTHELAPEELLVMPFDGGLSEICCEAFPPIPTSNTFAANDKSA